MYNLEGGDAVCQKYTVGIFNAGLIEQKLDGIEELF